MKNNFLYKIIIRAFYIALILYVIIMSVQIMLIIKNKQQSINIEDKNLLLSNQHADPILSNNKLSLKKEINIISKYRYYENDNTYNNNKVKNNTIKLISHVRTGENNIKKFRSPLMGIVKITSSYGFRVHPITKQYRLHKGIDIISNNLKIRSVDAGRVVESSYSQYYGKHIKILHPNGLTTLYAHMKRSYVKKGKYVRPGQVIGLMGDTGKTTGPHLHIEVMEGDRRLNPLNYIII